jgi:hypothetical protein
MMREKLVTNMTMEVNAATSRIMSVIYALLTRYVSFLFHFCSGVNRSIDKFHHRTFRPAMDAATAGRYAEAKREITMKSLGCVVILLLAATTAHAEDTIAPGRIIDAAIGDWNKDGKPDLALLVAPAPDKPDETSIGIYIYLRDSEHSLLQLVASAPDKIWGRAGADGIYGQEPSIAALPSGSIAITSQNDAIGRDRWHQTLTLAYRNNSFVVAGYTYESRDTLEPDNSHNCDYNVLTGKVTKDGKTLKADARTISIQDWQDEVGQKACDSGQ